MLCLQFTLTDPCINPPSRRFIKICLAIQNLGFPLLHLCTFNDRLAYIAFSFIHRRALWAKQCVLYDHFYHFLKFAVSVVRISINFKICDEQRLRAMHLPFTVRQP